MRKDLVEVTKSGIMKLVCVLQEARGYDQEKKTSPELHKPASESGRWTKWLTSVSPSYIICKGARCLGDTCLGLASRLDELLYWSVGLCSVEFLRENLCLCLGNKTGQPLGSLSPEHSVLVVRVLGDWKRPSCSSAMRGYKAGTSEDPGN